MDLGHNKGWCEELYECRATGLLLYGRSLGLSHAEAEDVLQDTFKALLQMDRMPDQMERYVLRVFRNRALNYRRGLIRRIRREFESKNWFESKNQQPEEKIEVMQQFKELPSEQREVIVLKIWHEHTFEAIGELLEISPNTAAARYRYGLQKLRLAVTKQQDESNDPKSCGTTGRRVAKMATKESIRSRCATDLPTPIGA